MEKSYFDTLLKDLISDKIDIFIKTSDKYVKTLKKIKSCDIDPLSAAQILTDTIIKV